MRFYLIAMMIFLSVTLAACGAQRSEKVDPIQRKDKNLSCKEILLEKNEAEAYRRTAENNRSPGLGSVLMPLGYISTYMDAGDAISAADARVDYLNKIYDILNCDNQPAQPAQPAYAPNYSPNLNAGTLGQAPVQRSYAQPY